MVRSTSELGRLAVLVAAVSLVGVAALSFTSGPAGASELFPLVVVGTIYDDAGLPADGASVVVENLATHATRSDTTGSDGKYEVSFAEADWTVGDTIEVTCTYETVQKTNSTVADEFATLTIDIHYDYAIPEFGNFPGVVVATLTVGAIAVISVRRRKAQ